MVEIRKLRNGEKIEDVLPQKLLSKSACGRLGLKLASSLSSNDPPGSLYTHMALFRLLRYTNNPPRQTYTCFAVRCMQSEVGGFNSHTGTVSFQSGNFEVHFNKHH